MGEYSGAVATLAVGMLAEALVLIGGLLAMWWRISNIFSRVETLERDTAKNDSNIECIDKKVDDIRVELGKIETKLDILLKNQE